MEKKEVRREDVIEALKEIAFGRVNRGVELAYLEDPTAERIRKMEQNYTEQAIQAMRIAVSDQLQRLEAVKAGHRSELQDELEQLAASVDQLRNMQKEMEEKLA